MFFFGKALFLNLLCLFSSLFLRITYCLGYLSWYRICALLLFLMCHYAMWYTCISLEYGRVRREIKPRAKAIDDVFLLVGNVVMQAPALQSPSARSLPYRRRREASSRRHAEARYGPRRSGDGDRHEH